MDRPHAFGSPDTTLNGGGYTVKWLRRMLSANHQTATVLTDVGNIAEVILLELESWD